MNSLCFGFVGGMALQVVLSLLGDPATYRRGNLRRSWHTVCHSPLASRELWRRLRAYNHPDFHPSDRDTTELIGLWRTALFGEHGRLSDKLATPAG